MVTSPNARARVIQWVREWYETHIVYRYSGEVIPEEMPQYEISNLPEGYQEIDRFTFSSYVSVIYQTRRDFRYIWIITSSSKGVPMIL